MKFIRPNLKNICSIAEGMLSTSEAAAFWLTVTPTGGFSISADYSSDGVEVVITSIKKVRRDVKRALDKLEALYNDRREKENRSGSKETTERSTDEC